MVGNDLTEIAMTASSADLYAPKKTGVYSVYADVLLSGNNLSQRWSYNADKKVINSHLYPDRAMTEGKNLNLFLYKMLNLKNQKFSVFPRDGFVKNTFTDHIGSVGPISKTGEVGKKAWNVIMANHTKGMEST